MRKYWVVMVAAICLGIGSATAVRAQNVDGRTEKKQFRKQQKIEYNALKTQQRNRKQTWNRGHVSSAERARANHQMQRERRDLKQRQKDARQDMRDRQRSLNAINRSYNR